VEFGPRPVQSEALEKSRKYIESELEKVGWVTRRQDFVDKTPLGDKEFINIRARFGRDPWGRPVEALLGSHYDTKFYRVVEFVGANDGGSSTGLLLEAARVVGDNEDLAKRVELVFFDGEEAFRSFTATDGLYGSRHYQKFLRGIKSANRPRFGIIFDLVGDRDLTIGIPSNSSVDLMNKVFETAEELGVRKKFGTYREIIDDHVPLQAAGLEVTNFIDMDYDAWHTAGDTLDKLSAESLETVGRVGLLFLEKRVLGR
jgi:hypothetical protein